ncbi:hypothetical protein C8J57DRAFT_1230800 [Mycena rebaudengoi]|nr:hypothetical protein C8J57DRAFT_1230800 [Mycena rebaudengoi]
MDFSGAQRGAQAEEYADAIMGTMPGFSSLSFPAQEAERCHLVLEAQQAEVGCDLHFWRSAIRIKKSHIRQSFLISAEVVVFHWNPPDLNGKSNPLTQEFCESTD